MIEFEYDNLYTINESLFNRKEEVLNKFNNSYMTGWTKNIDKSLVEDIINTASEVKRYSDCLVVIGIGGSFLGSYCVEKALKKYYNSNNFEIIYAGTTMSSNYMNDLLEYLKNKDFSINVISKSGTTMETTITYNLIKELMKTKYSKEELIKRIIITTDPVKGKLREEVNEYGYKSFPIPDDIGGRYSILTAAHLFPLAFNIDINKFIEGYYKGKDYIDEAYNYAVIRKNLFDNGKNVENFVVYEEKLSYFSEWLKQLFGETEGKNDVGILPISMVHTRDLHSLGQFIQEGNKIIFETFIKVKESKEVIFKNNNLNNINNNILDSVRIAHNKGNVSSIMITIPKISEENLGTLMYFFMMTAAFSGYLFDVEPFDQPGVEVYKKEVKNKVQL